MRPALSAKRDLSLVEGPDIATNDKNERYG